MSIVVFGSINMDLGARTVQVKIRDHRFRTATRSLTLRTPTDVTRTVYRAARGLLETWLETHGHTPVRLLGVGVSGLVPRPETAARGLEQTLDEVARRFGATSLGRGLALLRPRKR